MLPDLQRKLLRILFNFSTQQRRMPNWPELERKTGRRKQELAAALGQLQEKGFIAWTWSAETVRSLKRIAGQEPDPQDIVLLQSREPEERKPEARQSFSKGNAESRTRYWTQY
ncbi:hypothetical protein AWM70_21230 [Paenibacillus yonginensis]|uniref:LexA repressor DNA-binding domain-containing protein n=1 Tax=Paenibacillus yonginensis TaxID=1462996 RepID=A0A1B1N5V4_9BACL|nr:hypothetical protein [Paenibacillus yonginensis]ANS76794.1 hypothetical protein AWM70_21230 [Paenibacillus yonginensis]